VNKTNFGKLAVDKTQGVERTEESELPQGRGDSLVAQLDSAVNQAEQLRYQQIQQQYTDQLGVYVQEKAQQIDRLQGRKSIERVGSPKRIATGCSNCRKRPRRSGSR
jgi:hypothetical protein